MWGCTITVYSTRTAAKRVANVAANEPAAREIAPLLSVELPPEVEELLPPLLLLPLLLDDEELDALEGLAVRCPLTSVKS